MAWREGLDATSQMMGRAGRLTSRHSRRRNSPKSVGLGILITLRARATLCINQGGSVQGVPSRYPYRGSNRMCQFFGLARAWDLILMRKYDWTDWPTANLISSLTAKPMAFHLIATGSLLDLTPMRRPAVGAADNERRRSPIQHED